MATSDDPKTRPEGEEEDAEPSSSVGRDGGANPLEQTLALSSDELARARAAGAVPFSAAGGVPSAPAPAPPAPAPPAPAPPAPAPPAPAPPAPSDESAASSGPRGQLEQTLTGGPPSSAAATDVRPSPWARGEGTRPAEPVPGVPDSHSGAESRVAPTGAGPSEERPWDRTADASPRSVGGRPKSVVFARGGTPALAACELPERTPARPRILGGPPMVCWTVPWRHMGRDTLTLVCKASCDLEPDGVAVLRPEADPPCGDLHQGDEPVASLRYPSDFAVFKPLADVLLLGSAYGSSRKAAHVRFFFGSRGNHFERRAAVFGPRQWTGRMGAVMPSEPESFVKVPLIPELAFGGPGFDPNPVGTGLRGAKGLDGVARLPNIEDPERLIRSPGDRPAPVAFGPIAPFWPERRRRLGTYDSSWLATRWPYFPDDFDWHHYQAAPAQQRLPHLRADESYEIAGVRPDGVVIRGELPSLRPRCLACQVQGESVRLLPLSLQLDTVIFDTDEMALHLLWRGLLEVSSSKAPELGALYVWSEPLDEPVPNEQAVERLRAELAPRPAVAADAAGGPANDAADAAAPTGGPSTVRDQLRAAGVPHEWFGDDMLPAPAKPDSLAIAQALQAAGDGDADVRRLLELLDVETDRAAELRQHAVELLAAGRPLGGIDLQGGDLSGLDFTEQSLSGANLMRANLRGARLGQVDLSGAQLGCADLSGAELVGATLHKTDLHGAVLEHADLSECIVDQCDLGRGRAQGARFVSIRGEGVRLFGADLREAVFADASLPAADLSAATLDNANFEGAALVAVRLHDASGTGVSFEGADMTAARADAVQLRDSSLRGVSAAESVWDEAMLAGSDWLGATLTGASFCGAACQGGRFAGADLQRAQLRDAVFTEAVLLGVDLMEGSLEGSKLANVDLRGANLYAAETWQADLSSASLDQAFLAGTKLAGSS